MEVDLDALAPGRPASGTSTATPCAACRPTSRTTRSACSSSRPTSSSGPPRPWSSKLLPVLDTADLALAHGGGEEVKQVSTALFDVLAREGLERIDPAGAPFDPNVARRRGPRAGRRCAQEVAEVLRAGYRWKGRVLRPAMVKVRG